MINPDRDEFVQDNPLAAASTSSGLGAGASDVPVPAGNNLGSVKPWGEKVPTTREKTETFVRENPVPIIVGAMILGLAAGWALRHATREEKEIELKTPLGNLNTSFLSLPFLWPFLKSAREKYEESADVVKDTVRSGVDRVRKIDLDDYAKPLRKRWKSWTR